MHGLPDDELVGANTHTLAQSLMKRVKGQDAAVRKVAKAIKFFQSGLRSPDRPAGIFLFRGDTGVGKTELAKAMAEVLFGSKDKLIRFDMSEMHSEHSVARLIGAPPGYVGFRGGGELTEALNREPYSVVLLDEMGKANERVFHLFLQLFDEGRLTDGQGKVVDARNVFFVMTTNKGDESFKRASAEFLGRIDLDIDFNQVDGVVSEICKIRIEDLGNRLLQHYGLKLVVEDEVNDFIVRSALPRGGARGIATQIERGLGWGIAEYLERRKPISPKDKVLKIMMQKTDQSSQPAFQLTS